MNQGPCVDGAAGEDLYLNIEVRLEELFVQYSNAEIGKKTFLDKVMDEYQTARQRIDLIHTHRATGAISEADSRMQLNQWQDAMAAARWCLEWADSLRQTDPQAHLRPAGPDPSP